MNDAIFADLSPISRAEIEACGATVDAARRGLRGSVMELNGQPVALYGVTRRDFQTYTWIITTNAYFRAPRAALRATNAALDARPERELLCVSNSPHPAAPRWLKALGFEPLLRRHDGAIYVRRS